MKYFICALDRMNIGVPAERTERIIPVARAQTALLETEGEAGNQNVFISLPVLFKQKDPAAPHGVVLKNTEPQTSAANPGKTILLTPRIDIDLEIPEENIHGLPGAFAGLLGCFRGGCFNDQNLILILNPEKIMERIR